MGRLTEEVFNESCCDGPGGTCADTRELAEKHAEEHRESQCLTPAKMTSRGQESRFVAGSAPTVAASANNAELGMKEIRVVDPLTGGEKGSKLERYDLIPTEMSRLLARHYGVGARKYADRNWEKGYKWGLSYAALMRHLEAWRSGEDLDEETGSNHLVAVIWHATALLIFQLRGLGTDDLRVVK